MIDLRVGMSARRCWVAVGLALAAVLGAVAALSPIAFVSIVAGAIAIGALSFSARARVMLVLVGGLVVFERSSSLSVDKFAYLGFVLACAAVAVPKLRGHYLGQWAIRWTVLLLASAAVGVAWALHNGAAIDLAVRDALPVVLISLAPLLVIDLLSEDSKPHVDDYVVIATSLAAAWLFFAHWSQVHGSLLVSSDNSSVGLASFILPLMGLGWCWSRALARGALLSGAAPAVIILALLLGSGTRTGLLALPLLLLPLFFRRPGARRATLRVALAAAVMVLLIPVMFSALGVSSSYLVQRFSTLANPGQLLASDQSAIGRAAANDIALRAIAASPVLGSGPGVMLSTSRTVWYQVYPAGTDFLDSPLGSTAAFGILGALVQFGFLFSVYRVCRRYTRAGSPERLALACSAAAFVLYQLIESPILDKGLFLALICILPAILRDSSLVRERTTLDGQVPGSGVHSVEFSQRP